MLPNVAGPVLVLATLDLANAILLLSGLSFLGLGAQPPQAEWGSMVADGTQYFQWWWIGTFPGLAIFTAVLAFNFLGDSLRDVFDPQTSWARRRAAVSALLEVEGLRVRLADAGRLRDGRRRRRLRASSRARSSASPARAAAARRCRCSRCSGCCRPARSSRAARRSAGKDLLRLRAPRSARGLGARHRDGLPGPDDLAPPDALGRTAAHRARAPAPRARPDAPRRSARSSCSNRSASPIRQCALRAYPHQFSGGMRQRIAIAIALACGPRLLIADEPTTALDVTVQAGILRLLDRLRREHDLSVVLITHDLGVMSSIADRVSIFYAGRVVESGPRDELLQQPRHPYTRALLDALPHPGGGTQTRRSSRSTARRRARSGFPPGAPFHPRCPYAHRRLRTVDPPLVAVGSRRLACHVDPFAGRD